MNKLVTLPIVDAVELVPVDNDKAVQIAIQVKEAERLARRTGVARNLLERNELSRKAHGALCKLDEAATELARTAPTTVAGLVAKADAARLVDGYSEGFSAEIEKELAGDVLRVLASGTASRIAADVAVRCNSRQSNILQAVSEYRRAVRAEITARRALSKLVEKHPGLEDTRPSVAAGIREGKAVFVRCLADWTMLYGHQYDDQWPKFAHALDEARPAHERARRRVGITKAANSFYDARRATVRAFEKVCRMKPENPTELKAFAGVIIRHLEKDAGASISNAYIYSEHRDYHDWKDRRHFAMFTALRVLNHFAR